LTYTPNFNGSNVAGMIGISKKNKNIIFLPASGYFSPSNNFREIGVFSYVWSSSLEKKHSDGAYSLGIAEYDVDLKGDYRVYGQSVRAVVRI